LKKNLKNLKKPFYPSIAKTVAVRLAACAPGVGKGMHEKHEPPQQRGEPKMPKMPAVEAHAFSHHSLLRSPSPPRELAPLPAGGKEAALPA